MCTSVLLISVYMLHYLLNMSMLTNLLACVFEETSCRFSFIISLHCSHHMLLLQKPQLCWMNPTAQVSVSAQSCLSLSLKLWITCSSATQLAVTLSADVCIKASHSCSKQGLIKTNNEAILFFDCSFSLQNIRKSQFLVAGGSFNCLFFWSIVQKGRIFNFLSHTQKHTKTHAHSHKCAAVS